MCGVSLNLKDWWSQEREWVQTARSIAYPGLCLAPLLTGIPVSFQDEHAEHLKCELPKYEKAHPAHSNMGAQHLATSNSKVPE